MKLLSLPLRLIKCLILQYIMLVLKQEKNLMEITINHVEIVNIPIVYETEKSVNRSSYPTLKSCFFGAVKLTKHVDVICINIQDMISNLIE